MQNALLGLAVLACPIGMGAMMWFMAKGMRKDSRAADSSAVGDIDALRNEHRRLGEQIDRLGDAEPAATSRTDHARR